MRFDVLTLFPDMFEAVLGDSIIGRARDKGLLDLFWHNIRDFTQDKHRRIDDYPYGGGLGMVMQCEPIFNAIDNIKTQVGIKPYILLMTPQGKTFNQAMAKSLLNHKHIAIICGHYEGVDERVSDVLVDEEISIGDFILTGGEIAAMAVIDTVSRLIPNVLKEEKSHSIESFSNNLLEYPQYTRPAEFHGLKVPEILLSGHHEKIEKWRRYQSIKRTYIKRPDLIKKGLLSFDEKEMLQRIIKESEGK